MSYGQPDQAAHASGGTADAPAQPAFKIDGSITTTHSVRGGQAVSSSASFTATPVQPQSIDVECPCCHSESYQLIDQGTGLLRCDYCRNTWIDQHFIRLSETERFLREQAAQPKVVYDNSSQTDEQLMQMVTGIATGLAAAPIRSIANTVRTVLIAIVAAAVLIPLAAALIIFLANN